MSVDLSSSANCASIFTCLNRITIHFHFNFNPDWIPTLKKKQLFFLVNTSTPSTFAALSRSVPASTANGTVVGVSILIVFFNVATHDLVRGLVITLRQPRKWHFYREQIGGRGHFSNSFADSTTLTTFQFYSVGKPIHHGKPIPHQAYVSSGSDT